MGQVVYQVDSFTNTPFSGNPAAVCILDTPAPESWMKDLAAEMNLSETAFLLKESDGFRLRWFTPEVEVDLCGHATLASAHILWETGRLAVDAEARFFTKSGLLTAKRSGEWIEMDFPAKPVSPAGESDELCAAIGGRPVYCGKSALDYLLQFETADEIKNLNPDFRSLKKYGVRGIIVTARGDGDPYDFVSRFFAPGSGIDEDPVTGSAHCSLGPFWRERLGKDAFTAFQASKRGGVVKVKVTGERVLLAGQAVTVMRGELV